VGDWHPAENFSKVFEEKRIAAVLVGKLFHETWEQCYQHYFRRFGPIFGRKMLFFLKTNRPFYLHFLRKYYRNHNIEAYNSRLKEG
jgi:hypothetical protein